MKNNFHTASRTTMTGPPFAGRRKALCARPGAGMVLAGWLALAASVPGGQAAEVPRFFHYQGFMEHGGEPYTGPALLTFEIYNGPDGDVVQYAEVSHAQVENGYYSVRLGTSPEPAAPHPDLAQAIRACTGGAWLEVLLEGEPVAARQPVSAAPYALHVRDLHVDDRGYLGIGTRTPAERLHLAAAGADAMLAIEATDETEWVEAGLRIQNPRGRWDLRLDGHEATALPPGALGLRAHAAALDVMTWSPGGNVGIGTADPLARLDVQGSARVTDVYRYAQIKTNSWTMYPSDFASAQPGQEYFNLYTPFNSIVRTNSSSSELCTWMAEGVLRLPHGARLDSLFVDMQVSGTVYLELKKRPHGDLEFSADLIPLPGGQFVCTMLQPREGRTLRDFTERIINNKDYVYLVHLMWSTKSVTVVPMPPGFYGVYFEYTVEELIP